jgi:hypothetical protein
MTDRELMQQALDALESSRVFVTSKEKIKHPEGTEWYDGRIAALRDRLAKPHIKVQGPLHVVCQCDKCKTQRQWVGLTDEELIELSESGLYLWELWKAIEAKLKDKNT